MDAAAAIVIGADIAHDGVKYTRAAMKDLVDGRPRRDDESGVHPLVAEVREVVEGSTGSRSPRCGCASSAT